ncbi:MAG: hypothetical protein JW738_09745, partial [Actinobacteria bacterium]|nr:hypothetical protein [Actinomycetota bacterium]
SRVRSGTGQTSRTWNSEAGRYYEEKQETAVQEKLKIPDSRLFYLTSRILRTFKPFIIQL